MKTENGSKVRRRCYEK